jgi:hypothetical protein
MIRRAAYFSAAPILSLIAFHRVFRTWFQNDDFGWLSLRDWIGEKGLLWTLFHPVAQGTVRVFSERAPFLILPTLFGLWNPLPYRILAFVTWIAALTLAALIGKRLTASAAAGLIAAMLWAVNGAMTRPLGWASDYNEILCVTCILAAFYARLRGRTMLEWIAYLFGFGVLEVIVVYPAIAALHALCFDRKKLRGALPLFIPAAIFAALHFFVIPRSGGKEYQLALDGRVFETLGQYLSWAGGATHLYEFTSKYQLAGEIVAALMAIVGGAFLAWSTLKRDLFPLFCCGWFVLMLSPMLLLPNHVMDYAVTTALPGMMWLAGYAVVRWRSAGAVLAAVLGIVTFYHATLYSEWFRVRSTHIRAVIEGVRTAQRVHPGVTLLLQGVDHDVFQSGLEDDPFPMMGVNVYLAPGSEKNVLLANDTLDLKRWTIPARTAFDLIDSGKARVLGYAGTSMRDVTPIFTMITPRGDVVDVVKSSAQLGPGWYPADDQLRWMGKSAVVRLWGPSDASQKLRVTGYAPAALLRAGPVGLQFSIEGIEIGSGMVREPDKTFAFEFPMPQRLIGKTEAELKIEVSRTFRPPGDARELGMAFGTFAIR